MEGAGCTLGADPDVLGNPDEYGLVGDCAHAGTTIARLVARATPAITWFIRLTPNSTSTTLDPAGISPRQTVGPRFRSLWRWRGLERRRAEADGRARRSTSASVWRRQARRCRRCPAISRCLPHAVAGRTPLRVDRLKGNRRPESALFRLSPDFGDPGGGSSKSLAWRARLRDDRDGDDRHPPPTQPRRPLPRQRQRRQPAVKAPSRHRPKGQALRLQLHDLAVGGAALGSVLTDFFEERPVGAQPMRPGGRGRRVAAHNRAPAHQETLGIAGYRRAIRTDRSTEAHPRFLRASICQRKAPDLGTAPRWALTRPRPTGSLALAARPQTADQSKNRHWHGPQ
jgi:hypothetical protein